MDIFEQNIILQKKIDELEHELYELKQKTSKALLKTKIKEFINYIEKEQVVDINKELFLYIHNVKSDLVKKIKDNMVIQLCNFLLNDNELYHNNDPIIIIEKLNKFIYLIN